MSIAAIVELGSIGGAAYWFFKGRKSKDRKDAGAGAAPWAAAASQTVHSGYAVPVDWRYLSYPKVNLTGQTNEPMNIPLVKKALAAERSAMPPFVLHYRPRDLDKNGPGPDYWVTVEDGNPYKAVAGQPMEHFIQTVVIKGNETWSFKPVLCLWRADPGIIAKLNEGPRRKRPVPVTAYPSGEPATIYLVMGMPGGAYAPAQAAPQGEHGDAEMVSDNEAAEQGNVRRD